MPDLQEENEKLSKNGAVEGKFSTEFDQANGFIAFTQKYLTVAVPPQSDDSSKQQVFSYKIGKPVKKTFFYAITTSPDYEIPANGTTNLTSKLWVGPELQSVIKNTHEDLKYSVDYGIFYIFAKPIHIVLSFIQSIVVNWVGQLSC